MFYNYFKTAWRNLLKNKTFSVVNIFGLSVGMSVCLLIIMIIKDAYSYDLFHPESNRTYRVITDALRKNGGKEGYATSPFAVANKLQNNYPLIENWVPLVRLNTGEAKAAGKSLALSGLFTNNDFFQIFGFELLQGTKSALGEPFTIVLTEATAQKYFGNSNPIGETLDLGGYGLFKVTGILKKAPGKNPEDERRTIRDYFVDEQFIKTFDLKMAAGENFPANPTQQNELFVLVNEKFIKDFQLGTPVEALGQTILIEDSTQLAIRGVVKDFNFKPVDYALEPMMLRYRPESLQVLNVKVSGVEFPQAVAALQQAWNKLAPGKPFEYHLYDDLIKDAYASQREITWMLSFFAFLSLVIACLGMLGMAVYTAQSKEKEVSIRKVFGAGFPRYFPVFVAWFYVVTIVCCSDCPTARLLFR